MSERQAFQEDDESRSDGNDSLPNALATLTPSAVNPYRLLSSRRPRLTDARTIAAPRRSLVDLLWVLSP